MCEAQLEKKFAKFEEELSALVEKENLSIDQENFFIEIEGFEGSEDGDVITVEMDDEGGFLVTLRGSEDDDEEYSTETIKETLHQVREILENFSMRAQEEEEV